MLTQTRQTARQTARKARTWLEIVARPYALFVIALLGTLVASGLRQPLLARLGLLLLAVAASWLNEVVRRDRAAPVSHGQDRVAFATLQLVVGLVCAVVGWSADGRGLDGLFFVGVALSAMSFAAMVSELRQDRRLSFVRGTVLLAAAAVCMVAAVFTTGKAFLVLVFLGAIVLTEIGTELLSEDSHDAPIAAQPWPVGVAGLIVLFVGFGLMVASGANPAHALPLVAAIGFFVWMASSDSDGLVVVILVAVALTWATAPKGASVDEGTRPTANAPYFLVLGDSYISGEGASAFLEGTNDTKVNGDFTNECRQAPTAWGFRLASAPPSGVPEHVLFLGCSGAVTENLHTDPRLSGDGAQHGPRELALFERQRSALGGRPPAFVVVSIGGNDAGFGQIGETCLGPGNCAEVANQFLHAKGRHAVDQPVTGPPGGGEVEALEFISDDLDAAYARIKAASGSAPVIAVPYPLPLTPTGRCRGVLLDAGERHFIDGFVRELNNVIEHAARRNGLLYMDTMEDALQKRGAQLCSKVGGRAGLNFFALNPKAGSLRDALLPTNWIHNSLHPNSDGHRAMYAAAVEWFETNGVPASRPDPVPDDSYAVRSVDEVIPGPPVAQCDRDVRESCDVNGRRWLKEQLQESYGVALAPLVVTFAGAWLFLAPLLWFGRNRQWSVARLALWAWSRVQRS